MKITSSTFKYGLDYKNSYHNKCVELAKLQAKYELLEAILSGNFRVKINTKYPFHLGKKISIEYICKEIFYFCSTGTRLSEDNIELIVKSLTKMKHDISVNYSSLYGYNFDIHFFMKYGSKTIKDYIPELSLNDVRLKLRDIYVQQKELAKIGDNS